MKPIVHGLEDQYGDRIQFAYLDIDDPANDRWKEALGYRNRPHYVLLDGEGNILQSWVGVVDEAEFVAAFEDALN
jgi:hypothetical protein